MSENIVENDLGKLRCEVCEIHGPFPARLCAKRKIISAECEPQSNILPVKVIPALDTLLNKKTTKCAFSESGCEEEVSFELLKSHETKCVYRNVICLVKYCTWKGLQIDLHKHFCHNHSSCLRFNDLRLPIPGNDDYEGVMLTHIQNCVFVVKYKFVSGNVQCQVFYVSSQVKDAEYAIYKEGESRKLGEGKCDPLNFLTKDQCKDIQNVRGIVLDVKITYTKYESYIIDYTLISTYKCFKCMGYLTPYPFDLQPFGNICGYCAATSTEAIVPTKQPILEAIKNANFPCKWKYCDFMAKAAKIYEHEKICRFRVHNCLVEPACPFMDMIDMKHHLNAEHNIKYFEGKYEMTQPATTRIFTFKHNSFILVSIDTLNASGFRVRLETTGIRNRIPLYVQCEHNHCNIKSRTFCIINDFVMTVDQLPLCFKTYKPFSIIFKIF